MTAKIKILQVKQSENDENRAAQENCQIAGIFSRSDSPGENFSLESAILIASGNKIFKRQQFAERLFTVRISSFRRKPESSFFEHFWTPMKAGIPRSLRRLDSCFRRNDDLKSQRTFPANG
jgi:hypothetical protein